MKFQLGPADQDRTIELVGPADDPVISIRAMTPLTDLDVEVLNALCTEDDEVLTDEDRASV